MTPTPDTVIMKLLKQQYGESWSTNIHFQDYCFSVLEDEKKQMTEYASLVSKEKESRIAELEKEVERLKGLVTPKEKAFEELSEQMEKMFRCGKMSNEWVRLSNKLRNLLYIIIQNR